MAYSSSKQINSIATNYAKNIKGGKDADFALGGFVGDMEIAAMNSAKSAEESQKQRDYETLMSNTAHQREVEDLKKAGLNPILSAMNGASTPTTGIATVDTGATGSGSRLSENAVQAIVSRQNAQTAANAQMQAAAMAASAQKYSADMAYQTAKLQIENPQSVPGIIREAFLGATGDSTIKNAVNSAKTWVKNTVGKVSTALTGKTGITYNSKPVKADFGKSVSYTTFKSNSKQINHNSIKGFNTAYNARISLPNNTSFKNLKYSQFKNYNEYLAFCSYFNLYALRRADFNNCVKANSKLFRHDL